MPPEFKALGLGHVERLRTRRMLGLGHGLSLPLHPLLGITARRAAERHDPSERRTRRHAIRRRCSLAFEIAVGVALRVKPGIRLGREFNAIQRLAGLGTAATRRCLMGSLPTLSRKCGKAPVYVRLGTSA